MRISGKQLIICGGRLRKIEKHSISPELRAISSLKLAKYQDAAYLTVQEQSDGELSLKSHVRGEAGGLILGYAAYGLTKALIYGAASAGIGSIVVASGGAAGALVGAGTAAATAGASTGASIVAGAIGGAGGTAATSCATATAMGVVHAGGLAGAVTAVETAALWMGGLFALIPGPL